MRENIDTAELLKAELTGPSIQDLTEVLHMMRVIEKDNTSYATKWERLKTLIHVVIDQVDARMGATHGI